MTTKHTPIDAVDPFDQLPCYRFRGTDYEGNPDWEQDPCGDIYFAEDLDPILAILRGDGYDSHLSREGVSLQIMDGYDTQGRRYSTPCLYITWHNDHASGSIAIHLTREDAGWLRAAAAELEASWHAQEIYPEKMGVRAATQKAEGE